MTCVDSQRLPSWRAATAVTIGHFVFCQNACASVVLLAHEFVHVHQYEENGANRMVGSYLYQSLLNGYRDNPYEVEAYNFENYLKARG